MVSSNLLSMWLVATFVLVTKVLVTHIWCSLYPAQSSLAKRAKEVTKILAALHQPTRLVEDCLPKGMPLLCKVGRALSSTACKPQLEGILYWERAAVK